MQLVMSAVIGAGVYLKWEMAHPLIAMCVMQVCANLIGSYGRHMPRALWWSRGGGGSCF